MVLTTAGLLARAEVLSRESAQSRYDRLLRTIGDVDAFRARADVFALDSDELVMFDELQELEYLLGD